MAYTPIRIRTIKPNREISFDLYIHYKDSYLCYTTRGESIDDEKFEKLKKQKIAKFYITENDEENYQKFLDKLLEETVNSETASVDEKVNVVEGAAETAMEQMQKNPGSERSYKMTQSAAKSLKDVVLKNPTALKKIFGRKAGKSDLIIKHSLNVCILSMKLAEVLKCNDQEIDDLTTAALIHDIGLTSLSGDDQLLFTKPKQNFTPDDRRIYALHCKDSAKMLSEKPYVTKAVQELILNHEETLSGSGPNRKTKLTKLEAILSLVNTYDKKIVSSGNTPKEVLKELMVDELGNYELDLINKFKEVLQKEGILDA